MIKSLLKTIKRDVRGTSAIEMGLICALIILAMMTALETFAGQSQLTWTSIATKASEAVQSANAS